jgi:predicted ATPase
MGGSVASHPKVFELVGVAGVGKTTMFNALATRNGLRCFPGVWHLPPSHLLDGAMHTWGSCLALWRRARMVPWEETKHVIRLEALFRLLSRHPGGEGGAVLLDEGPVFALAWLRALGRAVAGPQQFARWWGPTLARWRQFLNGIILLEASIPVLAQRIRSRKKWHDFQESSDPELWGFLAQSRDALSATIDDLTGGRSGSGPAVVRIVTDDRGPAAIVEEIAHQLDGRLHGR